MKLSSSRISLRERILILSVIFALGIGSTIVLILPKKKSIQSMTQKLAQQKKEVAEFQVKISELAQINSQQQRGEGEVEEKLELNNNFASLIRGLSGEEMDFSVDRLAVEDHKVLQGYTKTTFTLEVETSFLNLGKFIESLEKSNFLLEIKEIDVTKIHKDLRRCSTKIVLESYVARSS